MSTNEPLLAPAPPDAQAAFVKRELPPLPESYSWHAIAVRSVTERGFHASPPALAFDARLMAQFLRLTEECQELVEAAADDDDAHIWPPKAVAVMEEAADVVIVCAQISWLLGCDLPTKHNDRGIVHHPVNGAELTVRLGRLGRWLRKGHLRLAGFEVEKLVVAVFAMMADPATGQTGAFEDAILGKLRSDEKRGRLHGEKHQNVVTGD